MLSSEHEDTSPVEYAIAQHWSLTPLKGKVPILKGWSKLPPPTPDQMRAWARQGNVGLRTGTIYVIDRDAGGDVSSLDLPDTREVETGSGGRHYYYRTDHPLGNTASKLGPHIDTRGIGGQVVYPGSVHPVTGRPYQWANDLPVADLPDHIIARLSVRLAERPAPAGAYATKAMQQELAAVLSAPSGRHNDILNVAAYNLGQLVGGGQLVEADVVTALVRAARCPEAEARATITSGLSAGIANPRRPVGRPRLHAPAPVVVRPVGDADLPPVLIPGPYTTDEGEYGEVGNHAFVAAILDVLPDDVLYTHAGIVGELSGTPLAFRILTARRVQALIDAHVRLIAWIKRGRAYEQRYIACTRDLAETVLASVLASGRCRALSMLVNYPVYTPGMELAAPGWNASSGIYYDGPEIAPITDERIIHETIADLIVDFPFDSDASRHNFYGLLLTPILRPALNGNAPLHLIESSIERAGKGKLVEQVLGRIVCGRPIASRQYQDNENDRDKTILALLMTGVTVLHFDNLNGFIDSAAFASLITAASYSGRILGQSATSEHANTFTIVGSGNNVRMSSELVKRTIPIMLRPDTDCPEYRVGFRHPDLATYLDAARPRALACLIGMIENWRAKGCPPLTELPFGGFESWASSVGGILWTAGFCEWRKGTDVWRSEADVEGEDLRLFVLAWAERGDIRTWTTSELFALAEELNLFPACRNAKNREGSEIRFGSKVLKRFEGRPVSGYKITRYDPSRRGLWILAKN